jgi:hypothetical protein
MSKHCTTGSTSMVAQKCTVPPAAACCASTAKDQYRPELRYLGSGEPRVGGRLAAGCNATAVYKPPCCQPAVIRISCAGQGLRK